MSKPPVPVVSLTYLCMLTVLIAMATLSPQSVEPPPPSPPCPARAFTCPSHCERRGLWHCKPLAAHRAAVVASSADDAERSRAAGLMRKRGLANFKEAVKLLRNVHARFPDDVEVKLELADALNGVMRVETNANSLVIEGTLDTPANKKIWRTLGDEALPLAKAAHQADPSSIRALAVYADAYMFSSSAKGIVQQAVTGASVEYKRIANALLDYPTHDSCVGCCFLGGFYAVAPWPVGNKDAAAKYFEQAVSQKASRRNLYYSGVVEYQRGHYAEARDFFSRAIRAPVGSETEGDIGAFLMERSREGLSLSQAALTKHK